MRFGKDISPGAHAELKKEIAQRLQEIGDKNPNFRQWAMDISYPIVWEECYMLKYYEEEAAGRLVDEVMEGISERIVEYNKEGNHGRGN